jgi:hypothetical protein
MIKMKVNTIEGVYLIFKEDKRSFGGMSIRLKPHRT